MAGDRCHQTLGRGNELGLDARRGKASQVNIKELTKSDYYIDPARDYAPKDLARIRAGLPRDWTWAWRGLRVAAAALATFGLTWYLKRPAPVTERETAARLRHVRKQLRKRRG